MCDGLVKKTQGLPFLRAVRDPRPAPLLRVWPGWMTSTKLRRFAPRRVTVHASPPRRIAYCVPHLDGTSAGGSKARATPRFFGAARASHFESAAIVLARRGKNASARSSSLRRRAIPDARRVLAT